MSQINGSIVLYHNEKTQLLKAIKSFLNTNLEVTLYLIDNSSNNSLQDLAKIDKRIKYIFNYQNLGYGSAHNIAMRHTIADNVPYHLILNPDIYFESEILERLFEYMEEHADTGNIMPQILYPDREIQHLCKLLPTPADLIFRRFVPLKIWKEKRNKRYELRASGYNKIMHVPSLSGCFMFLRTSAVEKVGLFDENIFMYLEDVDLNRRIFTKYKTVFYPKVEIVHEYAKESYKNKKLLMFHIRSAIYYFNKWGWIFDKNREEINKKCLNDLSK